MTDRATSEDRARLVASLGIPADATAPARYVRDGGDPLSGAALTALIDEQVVARVCGQWSVAADHLALQRSLASGVAMGYSLDRFREEVERLPPRDGESWTEPFERAVAARTVPALRLALAPAVRDRFAASGAAEPEKWNELTAFLTDALFVELGVIVPPLELLADPELAPDEMRIEINDARLPRTFLLPAGRTLVGQTVAGLAALGIRGEETINPSHRGPGAIVDDADRERCERAGLTTWTPRGFAILSLAAMVRGMAGSLVTSRLVEYLFGRLDDAFPGLIQDTERLLSRDAVTEVLRALVEEEVCIRNLPAILDALIQLETARADRTLERLFPPSPSEVSITLPPPTFEERLREVRGALKNAISHRYSRGTGTLVIFLIDQAGEQRLAQPAPLSAAEQAALLGGFAAETDKIPRTATLPAVVTDGAVRRRLRREIAVTYPGIPVLSYHDLAPELSLQPVARIITGLAP